MSTTSLEGGSFFLEKDRTHRRHLIKIGRLFAYCVYSFERLRHDVLLYISQLNIQICYIRS